VSFVFLSSGLGELENGLLKQQQKGTQFSRGSLHGTNCDGNDSKNFSKQAFKGKTMALHVP